MAAALRDRAVAALEGDGHPVEVALLGTDEPGPSADDLSGVELLVFVYPAWWGSPPAPLLGWIQHVLGPSIDAEPNAAPRPLSSVEKILVVTSHGSSRWINALQGEPGRHLLRRSVLPLCAPGATFRWISLYKLDRRPDHEIEAFVDRVGAELTGLTSGAAAS